MPKNTVLIGFAEAAAAPEVLWSLVDAGFRVVAFARRGRASALRHSRYVECREICPPELDLQTCVSELQSLLDSMASQAPAGDRFVLFPLDDKAVWLCSKVSPTSPWILAGPQDHCADLALNKDLQVAAAAKAGFNVPAHALVRCTRELQAFQSEVCYPIILKPAECVPTDGVRMKSCKKWICANHAEFERAMRQWNESTPLLVQSFVTGVGEGVFGLATREGVRALSAHRRVRMMNPQGSGSSACVSQAATENIKSNVESFVANTGWLGLFMIELLRDDSGKTWFVELNGRPWGSMAVCRRQGLEYPAWHAALAMDPSSRVGVNAPTTPGLICRHAGREFMHVLFVLRGPKSNALVRWPSFWTSLADVLHFQRNDCLYNWRRDDLQVFFADFYNTIHEHVFKGRN